MRNALLAFRFLAPAAAVVLAARAGAQEGPDGRPEAYRIAAGDTISIFVAERPDLSARMLVPNEGRIVIPGGEAIEVLGLSVEEVSEAVAEALRTGARLVDPRVSVSLVAYGSRRAFVYGEVNQPRAIDLPAEAGVTLTQAVAGSGGFTAAADLVNVRVTRRGKTGKLAVATVDAETIAEGRSPELDPVLEPGDTIFVPKRQPVYVLGRVERPGAFQVPHEYPLTVSKAVALAGGWSKFGRYTRVRVMRRKGEGVESFTVDLDAVLTKGELDKDAELRPGDIVYVPERVF